MAFITIVESKSNRTRCSCCGETLKYGMKFSRIEGQRYCHLRDCHTHYLNLNHDVEEKPEHIDREQQAEREREIFGAYQASGLSAEVYWSDKEWEGR